MEDLGVFYLYSNHEDGSEQIEDYSPSDHIVTVNTTGSQTILHKKIYDSDVNTTIAFTPDTGDPPYLSVATSADFDFGTGDFTIDWWMEGFYNLPGEDIVLFSLGAKIDTILRIKRVSSSNSIQMVINGTQVDILTPFDDKVHVAFVRKDNLLLYFRDGEFVNSEDVTGDSFADSSHGLYIGGGIQWLSEFRIIKGTAVWTQNFNPSVLSYAHFDENENALLETTGVLCIHSDDTDGSTNIVDSSIREHTLSIEGNVHHEVDQKKFGTSAIYFDGVSGSYISVPTSWDLNFGIKGFSIDFWIFVDDVSLRGGIFALGQGDDLLRIELKDSKIGVIGKDGSYISSGTINSEEWIHIALIKGNRAPYSNYLYLFVNGNRVGEGLHLLTDVINDNRKGAWIGKHTNNYNMFKGYIDEFRILKETNAEPTIDGFIPLTVPYSSEVGVSGGTVDIMGDEDAPEQTFYLGNNIGGLGALCIHSDNVDGSTDIVDSSPCDQVLTKTGTIKHSTDQKYFNSSSIFFDGDDDYLTTPVVEGENSLYDLPVYDQFTLDFWVYFLDNDRRYKIAGIAGSGSSSNGWEIERTTDKHINFNYGVDLIKSESTALIQNNEWYHIAFVKNGVGANADIKIAINGVFGQNVFSPSFSSLTYKYIFIGRNYLSYSYDFKGYIDEFRIVLDAAVWTEDFTPPDVPYIASVEGNAPETPALSMYRLQVTVDHTKIDHDLTHFPLKIWLNSSDDNIGRAIFDTLGNDPKKIIVTKADKTTQLYVEVERWDADQGQGVLWVSSSTFVLSKDVDTDVYIFFDPAQGINPKVGYASEVPEVWRDEIKLQYNMADPPGMLGDGGLDSTSNGNDGTTSGWDGITYLNSEIGGKAWSIEGSSNLTVNNIDESLTQKGVSIKIIGKFSQPLGWDWNFIGITKTLSTLDATLFFGLTGIKFEVDTSAGVSTSAISGMDASQHHSVFINYTQEESGSVVTRCFVNGVLKATQDLGIEEIEEIIIDSTLLSELTVYNAPVSLPWIKASHYNSTGGLLSFTPAPADGIYKVAGIVKEEGVSVERKIFLHRVSDGAVIAETTSVDGTFEILGIDTNEEMYIVAQDDAAGEDYNDLIFRVIPVEA